MIVKYVDTNDVDMTEPIAVQKIKVSNAIALLSLSKVAGSIASRFGNDNGKVFRFIDSELYVADQSKGTTNCLAIWVEEELLQ